MGYLPQIISLTISIAALPLQLNLLFPIHTSSFIPIMMRAAGQRRGIWGWGYKIAKTMMPKISPTERGGFSLMKETKWSFPQPGTRGL